MEISCYTCKKCGQKCHLRLLKMEKKEEINMAFLCSMYEKTIKKEIYENNRSNR